MNDTNFSQSPQTSYWAPPSGGRPMPLVGDQRPPDIPPDPGRQPVRIGRLIAVFVVLLVVTGVGAALLGYRQGESAGTAAAQASQRQADRAAAARIPDLETVAERHFGNSPGVSGTPDSLTVVLTEYSDDAIAAGLDGFLDDLGFGPAVLDRMERTRALDGTQTAEGDHCNVSWTYHPDHGLQLVFEADPTG